WCWQCQLLQRRGTCLQKVRQKDNNQPFTCDASFKYRLQYIPNRRRRPALAISPVFNHARKGELRLAERRKADKPGMWLAVSLGRLCRPCLACYLNGKCIEHSLCGSVCNHRMHHV